MKFKQHERSEEVWKDSDIRLHKHRLSPEIFGSNPNPTICKFSDISQVMVVC